MCKKLMSICMALAAVFGFFQTCSFAADEEPPKNRFVFSKKFENIADNSWSNLEFPEDVQPPGLYYIELTELEGTVGCWGSKKNPYEDGPNGELLIAWRDGEPMEGNNDSDFRLQYRPTEGTWVELIIIAPQGAIGDDWYPFGLQEAQESIGQTFIALEAFTGVGLQTPTWVTNDSGCAISLYSAAPEKAELASDPTPKDGTLHEDTWVTLSWRAGALAVSHDVYLGDSFNDVSEATRDSDVFRANQTTTFYVAGFPGYAYPEGLVPGTTYHWRIDEVNDAHPDSPWKGDVWSFSIPPKTAYNPDPADGADSVAADKRLSWTPGLGAKLHTVYFGKDFETIANATGGVPSGPATYNPGSLEQEKVYYWRIDEFDGLATYKGDVWAFATLGAVGNPQPANGATDVGMTTILSWTPADNAASHQVYLGRDKDMVRIADTGSPEYKGAKMLGDENYDPGLLELGTTYYWRVDEVYSGDPVKGPIWSFTVGDYLLIEDFESYTDNDANGEAIWQTWIDGFGVADNGAQVGYLVPPYCEQTIVHGGAQSMPLLYTNETGVLNSEASLTLTAMRGWTIAGVAELSLWFRGVSGNAAEPLYVAISNSAGSPAVVAHDDSDAATGGTWSQWRISLSAFADLGINLSNVDKIVIGLGSKGGAAAGGTGIIYIDDIRLY
ncbi:MAG: fibronectin type III domain-containing protein [Sedimentisphaerales bacterium]|nr:fibronectin type III domain-containing protein [Sedimentisphaerales bacterium]